MSDERLLFRGTTMGFPGNVCLQNEVITCATTDPVVATLFAAECRSKGEAIILVARMTDFDEVRAPDNHGSLIECAVNLSVTPENFAHSAFLSLDIGLSMNILARLGFDPLPARLNGKSALRDALEESHKADQRLSLEQLVIYNRLIREEGG